MRFCLAFSILLTLGACQTANKNAAYKTDCSPTAVTARDLQPLGLQPAAGKVLVVRILRTSCPSCRADLDKIADLFRGGEWKADKISLVLIGYNKPGLESRESFDKFVRERMTELGIPLEATQLLWINKSYNTLLESKTASGETLFADWKAVPYGMIFARDGRVVFRGQFTMTSETQTQHYRAVTSLQEEKCALNAG